MSNVYYARMLPGEFEDAVAKAPIAYLPLGTLEWHGPHLPLGADGIQASGLFERVAREVGGVVCPMLFVGPDRFELSGGQALYGMDICHTEDEGKRYANRQLPGSAYWMPRGAFFCLIEGVVSQLARAGFRLIVAHGHGPSTQFVRHERDFFENAYNVRLLTCWDGYDGEDGYQVDHAAANETSIMLGLSPELVDMSKLPRAPAEWPLATAGRDPRLYASEEYGRRIVDLHAARMACILRGELMRMGL